MAIPKLDGAAALSMMGLIIPIIIVTDVGAIVLEVWADLTLAICAGCMIFANYTYWLEEQNVGSKIAHHVHVFGSIVGIAAGGVSLLAGIERGIVRMIVGFGTSLNIAYGVLIKTILPIGPILCLISGLLAIQICWGRLSKALDGMSKQQIEVAPKSIEYQRNNLTIYAVIFTAIGHFLPNLLIQGSNISVYFSLTPLHYLGLVIMGISLLMLEKLIPPFIKLNKITPTDKPVWLYIFANIGGVGAFAIGIGTLGTDIIPVILKAFGLTFVNGIFAQSSSILIPMGGIFLLIGGILGIVGFNQVMFKIHDITTQK